MLDNTDNTPLTVEESYASAAGASNLRVDAQRRTPADMVIAAGMNPHRTGLALIRLMSEWDSSARPKPMEPKAIEQLADSYPRLKNGLVLHGGKEVIPLVRAKREAERWHAHELGLLFQRLKSLPTVRAALVHWAADKGIEGPEHVASAVLQWWLHQTCPACEGARFRIIKGTGRTGSKACQACRGSGDRSLPHGHDGRLVLGHINACRVAAKHGLGDKFNHQRLNSGPKHA